MSSEKDKKDVVAFFEDLAKSILHCPACGSLLKLIDGGPGSMCGTILKYQCQNEKCGIKWREDQSGILPRPTNLERIL